MTRELEMCREAEAHMIKAGQAMISASAAGVESNLHKAAELLRTLLASPARTEVMDGMKRIQRLTGALRATARHGNHLCLGWLQISSAEGYGRDGIVVPTVPVARSWEA